MNNRTRAISPGYRTPAARTPREPSPPHPRRRADRGARQNGAVPDVDRIYLGETDRRYVCDGCDAWVAMERMGDARRWERIETGSGEVGYASIPDPGPLDPPAPPTLYCCTRCGHEHVGPPSLKDPT
jgi:hypothetical protein